ncbi:hypothetical protein fugu_003595 [Takifugu bimaculatus]|uniref:Uncharacterized protein n=1 Tax=Takifugu bimaculatus TaxID=433685 RepID=A0A4Z2BAA8_9TELE|nr:hypothetical protein fugu_003595 [Takifugu bimaculatus]
MSQNGAGSPYQEQLPISSWVPGPNAYQSPPCSSEPAFGLRNVKTSDGYVQSLASPTSPLHQPPEGITSHYIGNLNIPFSPGSDGDTTPTGNASPLAIRSTTYCVPCEGQVALLTRLPLGALVTPLAKPNAGESPLQVCTEPQCVKGCSWCGASMCPAMGWLDCGQRFHCPFCDKLTEVPWQHYQPTNGVQGARVDKDKRPELSMGSYEVLSAEKVKFSQTSLRTLILAIDVSRPALRGGHLEFLTQQLLNLLGHVEREDGGALSDVRVGLMTYDTHVHLYDLSPVLSRPHMLVITDTEDLQLPVREGLLVRLKDCIDSINSVLQLLPQFSPEGEAPGGVPVELPVKAGLAVLQQDVGGAWPGHIPYLTGGALHSYSQLQGELDRERFSTDLWRSVEMDTAYKADLRIYGCRAVTDLFIPGPDPGHVTMATMNQFTTQAVELAHSRGLDETRGVTIQAVLSYCTQTGDRRTRVHTLTLGCSRHLRDIFRQYQAQTLLTFYCKKIYCAVLERPLQELRGELQTDVTEALASYRKHSSSVSVSAGQPLSADSADPPNPEEPLRCSASSLKPTGVYLVHAPLTLFLWVGAQVPACTLVQLFNTNCFFSLSSGETKLPVLQNQLSLSVRSLINKLNTQVPYARKGNYHVR